MGIDLAAIRKRMEELQNGRRTGNVQLWKPKEAGEYIIRGLPWPEKYTQPGQPFVEKWFYYIGDSFGLLTPHQFKKPDPINDFIKALYDSGTPEDRIQAKKLRPKMQAYLPIVVKKGGKDADSEKVLVWSINKFIYQKMLNWFLQEDIGDYLDSQNGFDIKVTLTDAGKKFKGKTVLNSDVELARRASPAASSDEVLKKLIESIPNIDDMYQLKEPKELKEVLQKWLDGGAGGDENDTGTERNGAPSGGTDALDELVNEVKGTPNRAEQLEKKLEEIEKSSAKSSKKTNKKKDDDDAEPEIKKQSLDEAFQELMSDEE